MMKLVKILSMAGCLAMIVTPAQAQYRGDREQRGENADQRADLEDRMADLDERIVAAQASGDLDRREALSLRRKLTQIKRSYRRVVPSQGFISAAESATYSRTLDDIEAQLPDDE